MEIVLCCVFLFHLLYGANCESPNPGPMTFIKQGLLSGKIIKSSKGRNVCAFMGIPFAKPPVNDLRFKRPVPAEPWTGIFQADTNKIISCPQMNNGNKYVGQEDCLVLNVFTPAEHFNNKSKLPVIIYFHGGSFVRDSGMDAANSPVRFLDRNLVMVTFNFRVGILGFFSTGDEVAPGNMGMFDQVEAMKWVQQNIAAFGGDPDKVTIAGQGSGSTAVSMHIVSPHTKNLYRGAILHSGTYFGLKNIITYPRKWAKRLAMKLKCPSVTSQQLLDCLMGKTPEQLAAAPDYFYTSAQIPKIFAPVVENTPDGFLPFDPREGIPKNTVKVPIMIGKMQEEGYVLLATLLPYFDHIGKQFLEQDIPIIFQGLFDYNGNMNNFAHTIINHYFGNISSTDTQAFNMASLRMYADIYVDEGVQKFVGILQKQNINIYGFKITFRGSVCRPLYNCTEPRNQRPGHAEDLPFLFQQQNLTETDLQFSDSLLDMWDNFATHQNPTPDSYKPFTWDPISSNEINYIDLNLKPCMRTGNFSDNLAVWHKAKMALDSCM